jgi:prepilin-type N-terminal cleavage/methylation domain-containing protein
MKKYLLLKILVGKVYRKSQGFTLVEVLVAAALFALISVSVYQAYGTLLSLTQAAKVKITATSLVNEQMELIRNLPYSDVGVAGSIPNGVLQHVEVVTRDDIQFTRTLTIRNIDDPFDGTIGGTPNDLSPADYKSVDIDITCALCNNFPTMSVSSRVAPKNLETASTNGALFVRVYDANGQPVPGALVHIENRQISPQITIDDVTANDGVLAVVDAPPGANAYEITVTKSGYTTDRTYATSTGNPNPTKPHATVLIQQVTQISFVIDLLSTINVATLTETCVPVASTPFSIRGSKLVGISPDIYKYDQNFLTNSNGERSITGIEWDTYSIAIDDDGAYYLQGVNPLLPVSVLPGATQNINLILAPKDPSSLLVTVKDSVTLLPVSGAEVVLSKSGFSQTAYTGRGYLSQTDWSGGAGQSDFIDAKMYLSSDGNIDTLNPVGEAQLNNIFGSYVPFGELVSSTFDSGTTSNFSEILWNPTSQPPATGAPSVRLSFASASTNTASTTWNFLGPDGTASTFYDVSNTNIHTAHNGNRYFKYKLLLDTASTTFTPNVSDISVTFTSECVPAGQVLFSNLANDSYTITVNKSGYTSHQSPITVSNGWQQYEVILLP